MLLHVSVFYSGRRRSNAHISVLMSRSDVGPALYHGIDGIYTGTWCNGIQFCLALKYEQVAAFLFSALESMRAIKGSTHVPSKWDLVCQGSKRLNVIDISTQPSPKAFHMFEFALTPIFFIPTCTLM